MADSFKRKIKGFRGGSRKSPRKTGAPKAVLVRAVLRPKTRARILD